MYQRKKFSIRSSRIIPGMPSTPATIALSQPTVMLSPIKPPRKLNTNSTTKPKTAFKSSLNAHFIGVAKILMTSHSSRPPITT